MRSIRPALLRTLATATFCVLGVLLACSFVALPLEAAGLRRWCVFPTAWNRAA